MGADWPGAVREGSTEVAAQLVPASLLGSLVDPDRDALVTPRDWHL